MTKTATEAASKKVEVNPYHFWAARFWHGMLASAWLRLLRGTIFASA